MFQSCDFLSFPISFSAKPFLCPEIRARFVQTAPAVRPSACLQSASQKKTKTVSWTTEGPNIRSCDGLRRTEEHCGKCSEKKKEEAKEQRKAICSPVVQRKTKQLSLSVVSAVEACVCVCAKPRPKNVSSETNNSLSFYNCPNSSRVPLF